MGKEKRGLKRSPTLPGPQQGHGCVLSLVYLPPCRFHSTDVLSGTCFQLFRILLGLRWQGRTAELPALAHTFCSLLSPSAPPGSMWPAVRRWRVEQRMGLMEQRAIPGHLWWGQKGTNSPFQTCQGPSNTQTQLTELLCPP